jgi:hypothetical protein
MVKHVACQRSVWSPDCRPPLGPANRLLERGAAGEADRCRAADTSSSSPTAQLVFTYLVPVLPPMLMWDGVVSVLRTYRVADLEAMTADLSSPDYRWEIGTIPAMGNRWPYLIGTPV